MMVVYLAEFSSCREREYAMQLRVDIYTEQCMHVHANEDFVVAEQHR